MISRLLLSFLLLMTMALPAALGQVRAELVALTDSVQPDKPLTVALRLDHTAHWHTYWINAGTGYPTSIEWELPEGWSAGDIQWPTPLKIVDSHAEITGNGYDGITYLPITLTPPATLEAGTEVTLKGRVDWLMCEDVCVPGNEDVSLTLKVGNETAASPHKAALLDTIASFPKKAIDGVSASATRSGDTIELTIAGLQKEPVEPWLFERNAFVEYNLPQSYTYAQGVLVVRLAVGEFYDGDGKNLVGVLTQSGSWEVDAAVPAYEIDIELGASPIAQTSSQATVASGSLVGTLAAAFLGGLILNLMPCVFPVLGIKILGFVNQAGSDRRKVALHGWAFSVGVLASFWALAGLLAILRSSGAELGWGFQLQSPAFVFALAALMLVFALSMSGVFEFGLSATGVGAKLQSKDGYSGSFFTGVLATVVATPCSAPFLAPALGAALALPPFSSFLVFTAIAVGLSTPYLLLSLFPDAVKLLPRPGAWMETFKEAMAFPLYATVGALVWVLAGQTSESGSLMAIFGLTVIAMSVWLYGRYRKPGSSKKRSQIGLVGGAILLAVGFWLGWPRSPAANDIVWEKWSEQAVAMAREDNRPVYVDFTARWCATCQSNKKRVFSSDEVKDAFHDLGVVMLKGDWTNRDPLITKELARWNRAAVPFNLVYLPANDNPTILPESLSAADVMDALAGRSE